MEGRGQALRVLRAGVRGRRAAQKDRWRQRRQKVKYCGRIPDNAVTFG